MSEGHITNGESFIQETLLKIQQNSEGGSVASELQPTPFLLPSKLRKMEVLPEWVHYLQPWSSIIASALAGKATSAPYLHFQLHHAESLPRQRLFSGQRVPHPSPSCRVKTLPLLGRPRLWDPKHPYLSYLMEWRFHMRKSTSSLSGISDFIQCHTHGAGMSGREKQAVVPNLSSRTVTWSSD